MWETFHDDSQSSRKSSFQLEELFINWLGSLTFFLKGVNAEQNQIILKLREIAKK